MLLVFSLTACEESPLVNQVGHAVREWVHGVKVFLHLESEKTLPSEIKQEMSSVGTDTGTGEKTSSQLAKANAELLFEMMSVIFNQTEIEDKSSFGELVHSLNQGASLEGIYNGIIMGSRYRTLEANAQSASPAVLKAFAVEMAELQVVMKNPTEFVKDQSNKPLSIDYPEGNEKQAVVEGHSQEVKPKKTKDEIFQLMLENFLGASTQTLKRVLGEEALRNMDQQKDSIGDLADWYGRFVLRMCDSQIDFGLPERNNANFDFHFKFAQTMALDRVKWEVLNRYHRYMNHLK